MRSDVDDKDEAGQDKNKELWRCRTLGVRREAWERTELPLGESEQEVGEGYLYQVHVSHLAPSPLLAAGPDNTPHPGHHGPARDVCGFLLLQPRSQLLCDSQNA